MTAGGGGGTLREPFGGNEDGRLFPEALEDVEVRTGFFVLCHGTGLLHVPPTEDTTET